MYLEKSDVWVVFTISFIKNSWNRIPDWKNLYPKHDVPQHFLQVPRSRLAGRCAHRQQLAARSCHPHHRAGGGRPADVHRDLPGGFRTDGGGGEAGGLGSASGSVHHAAPLPGREGQRSGSACTQLLDDGSGIRTTIAASSVGDPDPDWIRIQEGKNDPQK
jgi:hypothetical protein